MKYRFLITIIVAMLAATGAVASDNDVALKTNLLYDATLTVNAGAEIAVAPRWSVDLSGNINAWSMNTIGNIGSFNPKPVIGFAMPWPDILSVSTCWEGNTT